ncbi:MAG: bacterioferritin-associated ferredoxin [Paraglaciecola sp.]|jgi:bacterioferritin-associated ferredoxin
MLVCICRGITDKDIKNEIFEGASSFKAISKALGVGSCCGQCASFAKDLIDEAVTQFQIADHSMFSYEIKC